MSMEPWAIGVDIGGTRISVAGVSARGEVTRLEREATPRSAGGEAVLDRVLALTAAVVGDSSDGLAGIGIGFGGPVDFAAQQIRRSHHVVGWPGQELVRVFRERFQCPVTLDNDANAGGLGEALFGAGKGYRDVLYVNIGTGVGGAVILDGRIHHGASSNAGEFGHMVLEPDGPLCTCGKRGCVEALCSGDAIGRMAREADRTGSALESFAPDEITGRIVGEAACSGDALALEIVGRSARSMGLALAAAVNLLDPDVVVLGGGVPEMGETYLAPVRETTSAFAMEAPASRLTILPAQLGYDAGVVGAAALILAQPSNS